MQASARGLFTGILALALVGPAPALAQAPCQQRDLAGAWEFYIGGGEKEGPWGGWSACRVDVTEAGGISGPCIDDDGTRSAIEGGRLRLRSDCRISGRFLVGEIPVAFAVPRASLAPSGDIIAGVVRARAGRILASALFQMVRSR